MQQEKKYPIGGYAPGNYHRTCCVCKVNFQGDKRAVECEPCALEGKAKFDAMSPEEQNAMMKKNAAVANYMFSGPLSPERDLIYRIVEQWGNAVEMPNMEQWLKDYAVSKQPASGPRWVKCADRLPGINTPVKWKNHLGYEMKTIASIKDTGCSLWELVDMQWYDESPADEQPVISQDAHEKEVMMQAFDKVRKLFEGRQWVMDGRGPYGWNDDRYQQEVRLMYDEFDVLQKETWKNIQSKSFEYRHAIIADYKADQSGNEAVDVDELWDEHSELIDEDIDSHRNN